MQAQLTRALSATVVLILFGSVAAQAEVRGVDSAWIDMNDAGGTLKSVTIEGQVLAGLTFSSTATVQQSASATNPDRTFWNNVGGTNPTTATAALSGGIATDGLLNSEVTFQFGQALNLSDVLIFLDAESGGLSETVQIFPVDSGGTKIGDYSLSLGEGDKSGLYGANLVAGGFELAGEDISSPISGFNLRGVSFTLADMTGSFGNLSLARGFSIEDDFGGTLSVDPALAAIASYIPPDPNFNGDSFTDSDDLAILASNYGKAGVGQAGGDANLDGTVNYPDYLIWRQAALGDPSAFSGSTGNLNVPEPTSGAILLIGCVLSLACARRRRAA